MWTLGIAGHFMIDDLANNENIFFKISGEIFHPIVQGILLAAVISAIMSTADSQILVCSSSISLDLGLKQSSLRISRLITGGVIFASVLIALLIPEKIFSRVLFAWTAMGSSFGPSVIARISNWKLSENHILLSMVIGFVLAIVFFLLPDSTGDWIERVIPFFAGLICLFILKNNSYIDLLNLLQSKLELPCGATIKNRIAKSAMTERIADPGNVVSKKTSKSL